MGKLRDLDRLRDLSTRGVPAYPQMIETEEAPARALSLASFVF